MEERQSGRTGFWSTAVIVAALAYASALGPCCWISSRVGRGEQLVTVIYRPLTWLCEVSQSTLLWRAVVWYSHFGAATGWTWGTKGQNGVRVPRGKRQWEWVRFAPEFS